MNKMILFIVITFAKFSMGAEQYICHPQVKSGTLDIAGSPRPTSAFVQSETCSLPDWKDKNSLFNCFNALRLTDNFTKDIEVKRRSLVLPERAKVKILSSRPFSSSDRGSGTSLVVPLKSSSINLSQQDLGILSTRKKKGKQYIYFLGPDGLHVLGNSSQEKAFDSGSVVINIQETQFADTRWQPEFSEAVRISGKKIGIKKSQGKTIPSAIINQEYRSKASSDKVISSKVAAVAILEELDLEMGKLPEYHLQQSEALGKLNNPKEKIQVQGVEYRSSSSLFVDRYLNPSIEALNYCDIVLPKESAFNSGSTEDKAMIKTLKKIRKTIDSSKNKLQKTAADFTKKEGKAVVVYQGTTKSQSTKQTDSQNFPGASK